MHAGLPKWCLNKLTGWEKTQKVNTFCRRTCVTCRPGKQKIRQNHTDSMNDVSGKRSLKLGMVQNILNYIDE